MSAEANKGLECSPPFLASGSGLDTSQSVAPVHSPAKRLESPTAVAVDSVPSTPAKSHAADTTQRACAFCSSLPDIRKKGKELMLRDHPAELTTVLARTGARFLQGIESQATEGRDAWRGNLQDLHPAAWSGTKALPQLGTRDMLDTFKTARQAFVAQLPRFTAPKKSRVVQQSAQGLRRLRHRAVSCRQRASSFYSKLHSKASLALTAFDSTCPVSLPSFSRSLHSLGHAISRSSISVLKRIIQHEKTLQQRASDLFSSQCQEYIQNLDTTSVERTWTRRLLSHPRKSERSIEEQSSHHHLQSRLCRGATRAARRGHHARAWLKDVAAIFT